MSLADVARERLVLLTLAGIQLAHILDFMLMMPLGPLLIDELQINAAQFSLLISAYSLTAAISGITLAVFTDRVERKRMLLIMFSLLVLATLACGLAPSYLSLLAARACAGAFGGVLSSMVYTVVGDLLPYERRGYASGIVMSAFPIASVAGVPIALYIANQYGWRMPFFFIAFLALMLLLLGLRVLPRLRDHLRAKPAADEARPHPLADIRTILQDKNHLHALAFLALMMVSGFTVIPFITLYATANVGITLEQLPYLYLAGGSATFFTARWIGRLADKHGKVQIFRLIALIALVPLFVQTHLPPVPLWLMLICSTLFFVFVSGRIVPAMAILTSAAHPPLRGTFLALGSTVQNFSCALASWVGGMIISQDIDGKLLGYGYVGLLAMAATLASMVLVGRIKIRSLAPPADKITVTADT